MTLNYSRTLAFAFCILMWAAAYSQEPKESQEETKPVPPPKQFVTLHQGTFGGKMIKYKAIAGETYLKDDDEKPVASIWSTSYLADPEDITRPVAFVFNGGPGSASVWLHMGLLGPKITKVDSDAKNDDGAAPYPIVNNDHCLLDQTDIVFIDPVGTGYSRVVGKGKNEDYWGLNEDAASIAKFIRIWVTQHKRWNAPKYIIGESFGTTRAAAVTYKLEQDGQSLALNGLVLISQALDYEGNTSTYDNVVSYITYFPSMAAAAWYHKKAGEGKTLEAFVDEARKFTLDEYARALYLGSRITDVEKDHLADRIVYFTGLSKTYVLQSDLKIMTWRFEKELLRDQGQTIGQLDARFFGNEIDQVASEPTLGDPADYKVESAFTAALNQYFAIDLNVDMDRPYLTGNGELAGKWNWRDVPEGQYYEPHYVNVARQLGETMRTNTAMKVLVATGYYDLVCPFFDAEYTLARNGIVKDRVTIKYFEGGHMMYLHEPDLIKLTADIRQFFGK